MSAERSDLPLGLGQRRDVAPGLTRVDIGNVAFFGLMVALLGVAGWLYLYQTSEVAAYSREIRDLQLESERLHRELVVLRSDVAVMGSLERVLAAGEYLGYVLPDAQDDERRLYVAYEPYKPAASDPAATGAALAATPVPDASGRGKQPAGASWWRRLWGDVDAWMQEPLPQE